MCCMEWEGSRPAGARRETIFLYVGGPLKIVSLSYSDRPKVVLLVFFLPIFRRTLRYCKKHITQQRRACSRMQDTSGNMP